MSTVVITVEVQDNTSVSEIEEIVGSALSRSGVECVYGVEETNEEQEME